MNRLLYVARKVKGLSEEQLAKFLDIPVADYTGLEHSLSDVTARQALKLARLYGIEPELFLYQDGKEERLIHHAMDEVSGILKELKPDGLPAHVYFHLVMLGNTALTLQVNLSNAIYHRYELEKDNEALRKLNNDLAARFGLVTTEVGQ